MAIIPRYIKSEIWHSLCVLTGILLAAFLSQQIVRYLNYVAIGKISTGALFTLVGFEIPYLLAFLLPFGLYLGIVFVYGRLHIDNEMAILQLCGFTTRNLYGLALKLASWLAILILILMTVVNPWVSAKRQILLANEKATLNFIQVLIPGQFQNSPDGQYMLYAEKISLDHTRVENLFMAREKKSLFDLTPGAWTIIVAKAGYQVKDPDSDDQFFVAQDGYRYEGTPGENDYQITKFSKYSIRLPQNEIHLPHQQLEATPTLDLVANYADKKNAAELQWRLVAALSALLFAALAVPFSVVKPRSGKYTRLLPAVLVFVTYFYLLIFARQLVEQGIVPIAVGLWWVPLLPAGSLLFLSMRSK